MFFLRFRPLGFTCDAAIKSIHIRHSSDLWGMWVYIRQPKGRVEAVALRGAIPYGNWQIEEEEVVGVLELYMEDFPEGEVFSLNRTEREWGLRYLKEVRSLDVHSFK